MFLSSAVLPMGYLYDSRAYRVFSVCLSCMMVAGGVFDKWKYRFFAVNEEKEKESVLLFVDRLGSSVSATESDCPFLCLQKGLYYV